MSTEEVLAMMREKSMKPERAEAQEKFAQMLEDWELTPTYIFDSGFPIAAVVSLGIGVLIFIVCLLCMLPVLCCSCRRCCCCCIRRKRHSKKCRNSCHLVLGTVLAALVVATAIVGYRADREALDETAAVVCAGGRVVYEITYGAPATASGSEDGGQPDFLGFSNIYTDAQALLAAADGNDPDNVLNQVKKEVQEVMDTSADRENLKVAIGLAEKNMKETKTVTKDAFQNNIFVEENGDNVSQLFKKIDDLLPRLDIQGEVATALEDIELPAVAIDEFSSMDAIIDTVVDMASSTEDAAEASKGAIKFLDIVILSLSCVAAGLAVLALLLVVWQVYKPNKCCNGLVGLMALVMTLLSVVFCVVVAFVLLLRQAAVPLCDYVATDFMNVNSSHLFAKWYGEDSTEYRAASTCLSATGNGNLFEHEDGSSEFDTIFASLEDAKKDVCEAIPDPPSCDGLGKAFQGFPPFLVFALRRNSCATWMGYTSCAGGGYW